MNNTSDIYGNLFDLNDDQWNVNKSKYLHPHPADILRAKVTDLGRYLEQLYEKINDEIVYDDMRIELIKNYILALNSLYDSFFLIIKSLTPANIEDNKDAHQWLKILKPKAYISFVGSTKLQHQIIRKISNKLKHDHANIILMKLINHNKKTVYGFYVNSVIGEDDLNGPDTEIHLNYKKISNHCSTAFSFNHFLLYSLNSIIHFLEKLNVALFNSKKNKKHAFLEYSKLIKLASKLEHEFYPDEYSRSYLNIKPQDNGFALMKTYRYKKTKGEDVDRIYSSSPYLFFNQRTSSSHTKFPYLQLLKRKNPL